jgi:hypothetical protein
VELLDDPPLPLVPPEESPEVEAPPVLPTEELLTEDVPPERLTLLAPPAAEDPPCAVAPPELAVLPRLDEPPVPALPVLLLELPPELPAKAEELPVAVLPPPRTTGSLSPEQALPKAASAIAKKPSETLACIMMSPFHAFPRRGLFVSLLSRMCSACNEEFTAWRNRAEGHPALD